MRKSNHHWIPLFCISVFLFAAMFCYFQIKYQLQSPSENWSRAVMIDKVDNTQVSASTKTRITTTAIPGKDMFITFWNDRDYLHYSYIDKNGDMIKNGKIAIKLDEPVSLKAIPGNNSKIYIFSLENNRLDKYSFDYSTEQLSFVQTIAKGITSFQQNGDNLYLAGEDSIRIIGIEGKSSVVFHQPADAVDAFVDERNITHLAYLNIDKTGTRHIFYTTLNNGSLEGKIYKIGEITCTTGEFDNIDSMVIGKTGNKINIMVPIRSYSQQFGRIILYSFSSNAPQNVDIKEISDIYQYDPNPVCISKNGDTLDFLVAKPITFGSRTATVNISKFSLVDQELKNLEMLTRLKSFSVNPNYFTIGNFSYLQWENVVSSGTNIMYASTNPSIVKKASAFDFNSFFDTFLSCIIAMLYSFTSAFMICPAILVPSILVIGILILLFLDWVENNSYKVTLWLIRIHTITAMLFTAYLFKQNSSFMQFAPHFLQNTIVLYFLILITCYIAYFCMKIRFRNRKKDNTFLYQYSFFVFVNFVLYSLLVFPWDYI